MKTHELLRSSGLTDKANQKGRGNATKGNTSGKWNKGQKSLSGYKSKRSFEGWQTPLVQRMPKKKWFKRFFKLVTDITAINVADLEANKKLASGDTVTKETLVSLWIISQPNHKVKILGNGDIEKSLTFDGVDYFSASAKDKIAKAGGSIIEKKSENSEESAD
jgi:large subunit ribosomal protein L15